jgi:biopolymer transport protein ExbD
MVLMERIELVPMELKSLQSGEMASGSEPPPAITLSLDATGALFLDREPLTMAEVIPSLQIAITERPDTVLYLAVADEIGPNDRVPILLELWDRLRTQEMPVRMVGKPTEDDASSEDATINP